ncbi:Rha family transcriptional regulator [Pediococcus acidilactici]|uniref:Rha family transcriptional regulator n=1 Tax=Pediococcus acidilactici TaxID=1254 RepID=UPI00232F38ED|nr:Rha family transcriptional regulator [Pediococcus acidilactici]MDB8867653.1 Rha family transcriptional regulator [Pediococcus acidilactici]
MNELVIMKDQQAVTTSLQVAEVFGKNHRDVLRTIDDLKDVRNFAQMFSDGIEPDSYGRDRRIYFMNRDGFTLLAMGFTGKKALGFKLKYIEAFNQMEETIKEHRTELPTDPMDVLRLVFNATENTNRKVNRIDSDVDYLKNNQRLDPTEYGYISRQVRVKVNEYIKIHGLVLTAAQRSKLFKDINRGLNEVTGIKTRSQLRQKDFDKADEFINNWQPSTATVQIIKEMSKVPAGQTTLGE